MAKILTQVKKAKNIVIIPSFRLDADCMGSALGLKGILESQGKKTTVVFSGGNVGRFNFLKGADEIIFQDIFDFDFSSFDLAIFLDGPTIGQFYDFEKHRGEELIFPEKLKTISIDHHEASKDFADLTFSNPRASSACELIYELFVHDAKISKDTATALFVGISGDTGHFKHSGTTPECMRVAASLLELGVDVSGLYTRLYNTQNFKAVLYSGLLISKIKMNTDFRYAYYAYGHGEDSGFTLDEIKEGSAIAKDKIMQTIDGIDFCFTLRDDGGGFIKGSLRSRVSGVLDLDLLAKILSPEKGGGHRESAGFTIVGKTLEEAEKYVQETIAGHYEEIRVVSV